MSRRERKKQEKQSERSTNRNGISRIYYIVIGVLFVILLGLIIFIFSRSGDDVALNEEDAPTVVEETELPRTEEQESNGAEENTTETEEETEETATTEEESSEENQTEELEEESAENAEEDSETDDEEAVEEEEPEEEESEVVSENAPYDPDHATDFSEGSSDRVAIKNAVMQATGLGNDLIEWWIGNNGPGRVVATVSDSSQTEYYDVYLQYGDGNWHVTSYESVDGN